MDQESTVVLNKNNDDGFLDFSNSYDLDVIIRILNHLDE